MKKIFFLFVFLYSGLTISAQDFNNLSFGTDSTFEVMTWNLEWFPKSGALTVDYVKQIIIALDVDVLAIQEIHNNPEFDQMLDSLEGWEGYSVFSDNLDLAYIYHSSVVEVSSIYEIFITLNRQFPRAPLVMELTFMDQEYIIINNHLKCCGDGVIDPENEWDEETRRRDACNFLDQYITVNFDNQPVILVGDFNDDLADDPPNNIFEVFLSDSTHYRATDMDIALGNSADWSYPTWPSHLDHVIITNELFTDFEDDISDIQVIKIEDDMDGGFWAYQNNISDHRPTALKLSAPDIVLSVNEQTDFETDFRVFPNPSSKIVNFLFDASNENKTIAIYSVSGRLVYQTTISSGQSTVIWDTAGLSKGIYYASFMVGTTIDAVKKLVLIK